MQVSKQHAPILIVEDHADTREMYVLYLRSRGSYVVAACNGREALHRVHLARPAVIVVDLSLPAPGACQLIRTLRADEPTRPIPIIGLNGYGYREYSDRALQAGCRCVLIKPCLPDALANEIEMVLAAEPICVCLAQPLTAAS
jgi:CheY-like chemotaxis protein